MQNTANELWLNLVLVADDLSRLAITHKRFLEESQLSPSFHEVKFADALDGRRLLCFEQTTKTQFAHRPSDEVQSLVNQLTTYLGFSQQFTALPQILCIPSSGG